MDISSQKKNDLLEQMLKLGISEADLIENFILGSGSGGQKINKTSSCVYLKHIPTGIEVKCQKDRSREMNRFFARRLLCDRVGSLIEGIQTKREREIEKIRQQKKRRTRRSKEKMLDDKKIVAKKKENRKPVTE
ncbi:MAG: peptide chain release factor 1 [Candidatus Margulisbacteria bacterium GWF2_35_9]|nr:MAG: peptide chain release factor 1 [Candidatus Margulisbacteria bacterium GWF2_35_9]